MLSLALRAALLAALALAALARGADPPPAAPVAEGMSLRIEPQVACPQSQFDVIWEPERARLDHWLGVFVDHKLLYWCFLDGTQNPPLDLGASTGVGLMIGTAGTYSVHYFATPRPKGATPVLMQDAIGEARVTISQTACFELQARPTTNCELDPFELSWRVPSGQLGRGDRVGIFRAEDTAAAAASGLPPPPPPPALHWVPVTDAIGKKVLRIGKPGRYEARYFFGAAPTVADFVSESFQIVARSDPGCGDYIAVGDGDAGSAAATAAAAAAASLGHAEEPAGVPPVASQNGALPPPLMMVLQPITALPSTRGVRVPHANLGSMPAGELAMRLSLTTPRGSLSSCLPISLAPPLSLIALSLRAEGIGIMLWIMLLEDSTGAYRSLVYKGIGNDHRTPSIWLLPSTNQLTFQLSTTRYVR
jgi:hypothetical protein